MYMYMWRGDSASGDRGGGDGHSAVAATASKGLD